MQYLSKSVTSLLALGLTACGSTRPDLPTGPEAYAIMAPTEAQNVYRIGALDVLNVTVFQEPDLTLKETPVDASGNLIIPLIGEVRAQGRTAVELSREIERLLARNYLVRPQVSVAVVSSVSQRITVEGNVTDPGVYEISGGTTLLQALARAKSPTRVAKLDEVVVFRNIDGRRAGAVFNVEDIREGRAGDPQLVGGDTVVVGFSAVKGAFRDFLSAAPLVNAFRFF